MGNRARARRPARMPRKTGPYFPKTLNDKGGHVMIVMLNTKNARTLSRMIPRPDARLHGSSTASMSSKATIPKNTKFYYVRQELGDEASSAKLGKHKGEVGFYRGKLALMGLVRISCTFLSESSCIQSVQSLYVRSYRLGDLKLPARCQPRCDRFGACRHVYGWRRTSTAPRSRGPITCKLGEPHELCIVIGQGESIYALGVSQAMGGEADMCQLRHGF
jgi:hypothetical protein